MAEFYILDQDMTAPFQSLVLNELPETLDPIDLIGGQRVDFPSSPINLNLRASSGDFHPDVFNYLIPLVSDKIKTILDTAGVDNIDYHPANLIHPTQGPIRTKYWIANVIGCVKCIDLEHSQVKYDEDVEAYRVKSFTIDETKVRNFRVFRLREKRTLILVDEELKQQLEPQGLTGVRLFNTRDYKGF